MVQDIYKVIDNHKVSPDTHVLTLAGDTAGFTKPGQFVNVA